MFFDYCRDGRRKAGRGTELRHIMYYYAVTDDDIVWKEFGLFFLGPVPQELVSIDGVK